MTLAVGDLNRSVSFYQDILGARVVKLFAGGAYLDIGGFWLCLSLDAHVRQLPHPDYTHLAFAIAAEDFAAMQAKLNDYGVVEWKKNKSEGASFYFLDPDHHKLEIHVGSLQTRLKSMEAS